MASDNFKHPTIDWDSASLYQEFVRFRNNVGFVFDITVHWLICLPNARQAGLECGSEDKDERYTRLLNGMKVRRMTPTKFWINLNCIFVPEKTSASRGIGCWRGNKALRSRVMWQLCWGLASHSLGLRVCAIWRCARGCDYSRRVWGEGPGAPTRQRWGTYAGHSSSSGSAI